MPSPRPHILGRVQPVLECTLRRSKAEARPAIPLACPPASKAGLPPHLVSAARVAFWCAIGCIALLIAAVALSGCQSAADEMRSMLELREQCPPGTVGIVSDGAFGGVNLECRITCQGCADICRPFAVATCGNLPCQCDPKREQAR